MKLLDPRVGSYGVSDVANGRVCKILSVEVDDEDRFAMQGTVAMYDGEIVKTVDGVNLGYLKDFRAVITNYKNRIKDMREQIHDLELGITHLEQLKFELDEYLKEE